MKLTTQELTILDRIAAVLDVLEKRDRRWQLQHEERTIRTAQGRLKVCCEEERAEMDERRDA